MTYCSLQELYLHSYGQTRSAGSLQHGHQYNVLPGLHFHSKSMHTKGCVHVGTRGDRSILTSVQWAEGSETMETRSLLQRCMRGCWMPRTSLSLGGFVLLFPFFPCVRVRKGAGRKAAALLLCWVPDLLPQYRAQYSDHLASQGALWSLQWCQSEKRATPSRLGRRWLPACIECWSAVYPCNRNPFRAGCWAGGFLFLLICVYKTISFCVK